MDDLPLPHHRPAGDQPVDNAMIAGAFQQMAELLAVQDANPFRVRAYRQAARVVAAQPEDLAARVAAGRPLPALPGIGADLSAKITELATTGRLAALERLRGEQPTGLDELLQLPGLGPKRARQLHEALQVDTLAALQAAAHAGRIQGLPGFGARREARLAQALDRHLARSRRWLRPEACALAGPLLDFAERLPGVQQAALAGSLRRGRETVGDIDLLLAAAEGGPVCRRFIAHPAVREVVQAGDTRVVVLLDGGLQVDLRVVPPESWGAALLYFTGAKAHNIRLRSRALARGLKLNEYGLFDGPRAVAGRTEAEVYAALDLPWIPPELREDRGEIEAAQARQLPRLVQRGDLRGDLHAHSDWADGHAGLAAMAEAARAQGLGYLAVCDHAHPPGQGPALDAARLARQVQEIARLNDRLQGIELLAGVEVDILSDGRLALPDAALAPLDLVVAAVHTDRELPRARQTERVLAALDYPLVRLLAHPTGRLIGQSGPLQLDMLAVMRKCRDRGIALELGAQPGRLDLTDLHCRMARELGVPVAISADASAPADLAHLALGIDQARRGWLEPADVLNTLSLHDLRRWLQRRR